VKPGEDVVFVGCGHAEPCGELVRPCSVDLYGCMEFRHVRGDGRLVARLDSGEFELFEAGELATVEQVAALAVARDDGYVDFEPGKGTE
jgi:hypothetical protein